MGFVATGLGGTLVGLVLGAWLCYIYAYKPLAEAFDRLLDQVIAMRKQGFVPQFDLQQKRSVDLAADIREL